MELARRTVEGKTAVEQMQMLTRANLATFDIKAIDNTDDILEMADAEDIATEFLAQVKDLNESVALKRMLTFLKR